MNDYEIMELMKEIEYGWIDKDNKKYTDNDDLFFDKYILQSPQEIIKNKIGVCWDQVELERYYFENNKYNIKTYFLVHYDNNKCPTHTFLVYKKNDKYYWFEHAWEKFKGIHEYNSINDLLFDVRNKFIKYELNNNYNGLVLHEYPKPNYHISVQEFFNHCDSSKYIDLEQLKNLEF